MQSHTTHLKRSLGRWDVVLMIVVALVSLNTMAPIASNGALALWVWPIGFVFFFIPQGLTVVELSQHYPGEGAVYVWPTKLLGEANGFLSGWCYWMANIVYVPTLIVSSVGFAAYLLGGSDAALADHSGAIETGAFALLALLIWLNIRGLGAEKWLVDAAALGTLLAVIVVVSLASSIALRDGIPATPFTSRPERFDWHLVSIFSLVCFSLLGLEIAANVGDEIRNALATLPRALLIGAVVVGCIDLLVTLSLLVALPAREIGVLQGVLQAVEGLSRRLALTFVTPTIAALLALSVAGAAAAWLAAPARIPYVAALEGKLPQVFARLHPRYASPHIALLLCGGLCAITLWMSFARAGLNEAFTTILDLSVILSLVQYLYMFGSLLALVFRRRHLKTFFKRPLLAAAGICGILSTLVATGFAFVPTRQVEHVWLFELKLASFCAVVMGLGAVWFYVNSSKRSAGVSTRAGHDPG